MTLKELQTLKSKLPRGYRRRIHEKTGLSFGMIDYVFRGERTSDSVVDAALEFLEQHVAAEGVRRNRLNTAIHQSC